MRDQQHRDTTLAQHVERSKKTLGFGSREACRRFIEYKNCWLDRQRPGQRDKLPCCKRQREQRRPQIDVEANQRSNGARLLEPRRGRDKPWRGRIVEAIEQEVV